jgi:hypothetical protein
MQVMEEEEYQRRHETSEKCDRRHTATQRPSTVNSHHPQPAVDSIKEALHMLEDPPGGLA